MSKPGDFSQCANCVNPRLDPQQCKGCMDGWRYSAEPPDSTEVESLTLDEFRIFMRGKSE